MIRLRRSAAPKKAPAAPGHDESWGDSALWGASLAIFLVVAMILGVGYLGYASMERPRRPAPAAVHATARAAAHPGSHAAAHR